MRTTARGRPPSVRSVGKALDLLALLARSAPLSVKVLAAQLGLPRSSVYRFLATLESRDLVIKHAAGIFSVGPGLVSLVNGAAAHRDLRDAAISHMRRLAAALGETVFLAVAQGSEAVVIEKVASESPVRLQLEVGQRIPLHAGALGKILLAYDAGGSRALARRQLPRLAPRTVTDPQRLRQQLKRIHAQGYAVTLEEAVPGSWGVGVPIRSRHGSVVASLLLGGPLQRYEPVKVPAMITALQRAARRIAGALDTGLVRSGQLTVAGGARPMFSTKAGRVARHEG